MEATTTYAAGGRVAGVPDEARGVLVAAREETASVDRAEARKLGPAVQWAV